MAQPTHGLSDAAHNGLLRDICSAVAGANEVHSAARAAIDSLRAAGLIHDGAIEIQEIAAPASATPQPGDLDSVLITRIPTMSAPPAMLRVAPASPDLAPLIPSVTAFLGLALDRAYLAERSAVLREQADRRIAEVSTIYEIGQAIDTVEIDRLLELITERAAKVMEGHACSLMRLNPETHALTIAASHGLSDNVVFVTHRAVGEGIAGIVAQTGEPMLIVDAEHDPRLAGIALRPDIGSSMIVPMKNEAGAVTGVLSIHRLRPEPAFDEGSLRLFSIFASQAALAISNVELYRSLQHRVEELRQLGEDRERRYKELNRLATQTDNILRSIAASVLVTDARGMVIRWNRSSEEMWSISEEEATRLPYAHVIERFGLPVEEARQLREVADRVAGTGEPAHVYKLALHPRRQRKLVVNLLVNPLIDRGGQRLGLVQTMEDVTRETEMESEITRMRRLADIGQLAAKLAHEVRNPLSSIKGAAQLMRNDYADLAPLREFLDIIVEEVNALNRITTDLLDFARPMQLETQWVSVSDIAERTLQFMANHLKSHSVSVETKAHRGTPDILADPKQIEQVMRNVIINAVDAMPQGGRLTITTSALPGGGASIRVEDTGVGIPEDKLEEIFQPFVTTKTKGTGLGLPIVRKIVENHGGQIRIASRLGEGTAFTITLPTRPPRSAALPPERVEHAPLPDL